MKKLEPLQPSKSGPIYKFNSVLKFFQCKRDQIDRKCNNYLEKQKVIMTTIPERKRSRLKVVSRFLYCIETCTLESMKLHSDGVSPDGCPTLKNCTVLVKEEKEGG
jgi:hypothetical protein